MSDGVTEAMRDKHKNKKDKYKGSLAVPTTLFNHNLEDNIGKFVGEYNGGTVVEIDGSKVNKLLARSKEKEMKVEIKIAKELKSEHLKEIKKHTAIYETLDYLIGLQDDCDELFNDNHELETQLRAAQNDLVALEQKHKYEVEVMAEKIEKEGDEIRELKKVIKELKND